MIKINPIYKPTPLYKELKLLNFLATHSDFTQRDIASYMDVSVAMVNSYLEKYEKEGLVEIVRDSTRSGTYTITRDGIQKRQLLNMMYLEASLLIYNDAKKECLGFVNKIQDKGFKNLLFYGAGEVCELLLYVINNLNEIDINVLAIIDDNKKKIGQRIASFDIISIKDINKYNYDAILVSSYVHSSKIKENLINEGISEDKIIEFYSLED